MSACRWVVYFVVQLRGWICRILFIHFWSVYLLVHFYLVVVELVDFCMVDVCLLNPPCLLELAILQHTVPTRVCCRCEVTMCFSLLRNPSHIIALSSLSLALYVLICIAQFL